MTGRGRPPKSPREYEIEGEIKLERLKHEWKLAEMHEQAKHDNVRYFAEWLRADHRNVIFAFAVGATSLTALSSLAGSGGNGKDVLTGDWGWLLTNPVTAPGGLVGSIIATKIRDQMGGGVKSPWSIMGSLIEMTSLSVAACCWALLFMEALCGEKGIGGLVGSLGGVGALASIA